MEILPTPQSRIEELMKAFITRDMTCLSQPQSRIEEYWHHMIEGTNIMPIPQSRVEALLKKIIENDTNEIPHAQSRIEEFLISILTGEIDNLPIPQSRSELYLDYIARNNRPVEDIEYVSYSGTNITAHNTIEKPIKSAILKGNTKRQISHKNLLTDNKLPINNATSSTNLKFECPISSGVYTVFITYCGNTIYNGAGNLTTKFIDNDDSIVSNTKYLRIDTLKVNTTLREVYTLTGNSSHFSITMPPATNINFVDIYVVEGEVETLSYVLQSVKMPVLTTTGKNLLHVSKGCVPTSENGGITISRDEINQTITLNGTSTIDNNCFALAPIDNLEILKGETYTITAYLISGVASGNYSFRLNDKGWSNVISTIIGGRLSNTKTYVEDVLYTDSSVRIDTGATFENAVFKVQFEKNTTSTSYEPFKSNILSANEEVELHGTGDVKDEFNLLTGELTQRIKELVLNGSESGWFKSSSVAGDGGYRYALRLNNGILKDHAKIICDKFAQSKNAKIGYVNYVTVDNGLKSSLYFTSTITTIEEWKTWLAENNVKIQYQLATESIKTVDLSVVNQDENKVNKVSAFNDITHIISSSDEPDSLIAEAIVEVPTKLPESLINAKELGVNVE